MTSANSTSKSARKPRASGVGKRTTRRTSTRMPRGVAHRSIHDASEQFSPEEWHDMVATAAYYRAEARGFDGASPEDDWHGAEAELRERLARAEEDADNEPASGLDAAANPAEENDNP